jgi:hypothetical protein
MNADDRIRRLEFLGAVWTPRYIVAFMHYFDFGRSIIIVIVEEWPGGGGGRVRRLRATLGWPHDEGMFAVLALDSLAEYGRRNP